MKKQALFPRDSEDFLDACHATKRFDETIKLHRDHTFVDGFCLDIVAGTVRYDEFLQLVSIGEYLIDTASSGIADAIAFVTATGMLTV